MSTTTLPAVDRIGTVVDIVAVAWSTTPVAFRGPDNEVIAFTETWDRDSITLPPAGSKIRLLSYHDRRRPIGWLDRFHLEDDGLHATGRLIGSTTNLDQLREVAAAGLLADVSIGFSPSIDDDEWHPPQRRNGLASVTRRHAIIREVSLVDAAALPGSRVLTIRQPTTTSSVDAAALREADTAVTTGIGARMTATRRMDDDLNRREILAEADAAVAAGERWAHLVADATTQPVANHRNPRR